MFCLQTQGSVQSAFRVILLLISFAASSVGQTLVLQNEIRREASLIATVATLSGKSELHLTNGGDPIPGCTIHLNSGDSWLFFDNIVPSAVNATLLGRVRVNGAIAVDGGNVRVVQYLEGSVVIPHAANYQPLRVFSGGDFTGTSTGLSPHTAYGSTALGSFANNIRSFVLKRGYTATFARNEDGTGFSMNYVAQDSDLEVAVLPGALSGAVRFIRVFPWRWVSKKGSCDIDPVALKAKWHYNWSISSNSTPDWEYVAIKQQPYWPGLSEDWKARGVNHLSGFNEPDNPVEDAYKNLTPQGSTADAVARWPELLGTGLRVGAPAVTDGGTGWITDFMNRVNAAGHRVDYVPVHYYRSYWNKTDPAGAATQMYNFLKSIHDMAQRPIWVTEFNNGADWTDNAHDPDVTQNRNAIEAMINMMDATPWIERYAVYSRVEEFRQTHLNNGSITPMGQMYRDHVAPMAHQQVVPDSGKSPAADYLFEGNTRDSSGNGNNPLVYGTPLTVAGRQGQALSFDGTDDYLALPPRIGDSTDFTFTGWVKWNGGGDWQRIFDLGDGTAKNLFLCPKSGGNTLRFVIKNGGAEQQLNSTPLTPGVWTHLAVTLAGDTGKLFVNGSLVNTNTAMTINPGDIGTRANYLGKSQWPDPLFNGLIDSARFYTTALSDAKIAAAASGAGLQFATDPLQPGGALTSQPFTGDLAASASAGNGGRVFTKLGGPAWLAIAPDGGMTGVPSPADNGMNHFLVRVTDSSGLVDTAALEIPVSAAPGLVARYNFNSTPLATAGNAHGTASGGPGYTPGKSGSAINLDGADDFVSLPFGVANHDEITVAAWIHWDGGEAWQRIFDFGNGTADNFFLTPRAGGTNGLRFSINSGGVTQTIETGQLAAGQWVHVAVTLGSNTGRLFVNGGQVASAAVTLKPSDILPSLNFIGKSQWPDPLFDGRLDEFVIFNRALGPAEVSALHAGTAPAFASDPLNLPAAPVGAIYDRTLSAPGVDLTYSKVSGPRWLTVSPDGRISGIPAGSDAGTNRFVVRVANASQLGDDATVNIVVPAPTGLMSHLQLHSSIVDSAGSFSGVASGGPLHQDAIFDKAIDLDGSDDFVTVPSGMVNGLNDITIASRVRWDGGGAWQRIFDFGNNTTQYMVLTPRSGGGTLRFTISTNGIVAGAEQRLEAPPLPVGEWSHVAVTLVGDTGTLYVNGAPAATGTISLNPSSVAPTKNYLGKSQFPDPYFNGMIDDFRIYDRGLSAAEVKALAIPAEPVSVPAGTYEAWAGGISFPPGQSGPELDPENDGILNLMEWLLSTDPLGPSAAGLPSAGQLAGSVLGGAADPEKTYLSLKARVRKNRPGATMVPEAGADLTSLSNINVNQAGAPVPDGDHEIFTWYYKVPVEDSGQGFMRLRVTKD